MTTIHDEVYHPQPKIVAVPQTKLDAIEKARQELFKIFPDPDTVLLEKLLRVTGPMWEIANTKWDEAK